MTGIYLLRFYRESLATTLQSTFTYIVPASSVVEAIENYLLKDNSDFNILFMDFSKLININNNKDIINFIELCDKEEVKNLDVLDPESKCICSRIIINNLQLFTRVLLYVHKNEHFGLFNVSIANILA